MTPIESYLEGRNGERVDLVLEKPKPKWIPWSCREAILVTQTDSGKLRKLRITNYGKNENSEYRIFSKGRDAGKVGGISGTVATEGKEGIFVNNISEGTDIHTIILKEGEIILYSFNWHAIGVLPGQKITITDIVPKERTTIEPGGEFLPGEKYTLVIKGVKPGKPR